MSQNYPSLFKKYIKHSNEKESALNTIFQFISNYPQESLILDVGCGTGKISHALAQKGHKIFAIDQQDYFQRDPRIQFQKTNVFDFKTNEKFDLIIAAYLFWEIPFERWEELMNLLLNLLKTDGKLLVIDSVNTSPYDNPFFSCNIFSDRSEKENRDLNNYWFDFLKKNNCNFKSNKIKSQVQTKSKEEMLNVLEFFFFDENSQNLFKNQKKYLLEKMRNKKDSNLTIIELEHSMEIINPK